VVLFFSVRYLWKRNESDDLIAASAAEVGATFNALTLVLGMIWGRPAWGVWWTWDARLTSTLVLFLIFLGYLALRAFVEDPERDDLLRSPAVRGGAARAGGRARLASGRTGRALTMRDQNWAFVAAAYTAAWIAIIGYWLHVHGALRRARRLHQQAVRAGAGIP
jgi:hypothetical protein